MELDIFETHDRLNHFIKDQSDVISQGCNDCLKKNPYSLALQEKSPYIYIFGHARTADDGFNKKLFWQPRLSKPEAQENSYLFRAKSYSDELEVCWVLPPFITWKNFQKETLFEDNIISWSIHQFKTNKKELEKSFKEDFSEERGTQIIKSVIQEHLDEKNKAKLSV